MINDRAEIRIATRGSPLALWQAEHVAARLEALHPGLRVSLLTMKTRGDKLLDAPLAKVGSTDAPTSRYIRSRTCRWSFPTVSNWRW